MMQHTTGNCRPAFEERVLALARALPLPETFPRPDIFYCFVKRLTWMWNEIVFECMLRPMTVLSLYRHMNVQLSSVWLVDSNQSKTRSFVTCHSNNHKISDILYWRIRFSFCDQWWTNRCVYKRKTRCCLFRTFHFRCITITLELERPGYNAAKNTQQRFKNDSKTNEN